MPRFAWQLMPALALALAVVGACAPMPVADAATAPLEGTRWRLVSLRGQAIAPAPPEREAHLVLQAADRRVAGHSGCNRLVGSYTRDGAVLRFGPAAGTRMACMAGMDTEASFLSMMGAVQGWRVSGQRLQLLDGGNAVLAEFVAGT